MWVFLNSQSLQSKKIAHPKGKKILTEIVPEKDLMVDLPSFRATALKMLKELKEDRELRNNI